MRRLFGITYGLMVPLLALTGLDALGRAADHQHGGHQTGCAAPLLANLGNLEFPVTTNSPRAQLFFNQGMTLAFAFNHDEAERSFREASEIDPGCAMCFWGQALVIGPNINKPMPAEDEKKAAILIKKAQLALDNETPREVDYVKALAQRYSRKITDRTVLDQAYANAMQVLHQKYPDDMHAATLYAESLMDLSPWNYWTADGQYGPHTEKMVNLLQAVLKKTPDHPGANHYLIHVVESQRPELGIEAADRLLDLVPGAGHLQHMPAHIYIRTGRYYDAVQSNLRGIFADKSYLAGCHLKGFYAMMYVPHNFDFLVAVAYLAGDSKLALNTAQELREYAKTYLHHDPEMYDHQGFYSSKILTQIRLNKFDSVLAEMKPAENHLLSLGLWHYARAVAFIGKGNLVAGSAELEKLRAYSIRPELQAAMLMGVNKASSVLAIGALEAEGLLAAKRGQIGTAEKALRAAILLQDQLVYMEPPAWHRSERLVLGEVLNNAGRFQDAEAEFRGDLKKFPENGYALYGLYESLIGQGRNDEAAEVFSRYRTAFQYADFDLAER